MNQYITSFCLLFWLSCSALATDNATRLTGYQSVPENWRSEIIPFPFEFAPNIPLNGVEELLFAPGMYKEGDEQFFSYGFVWIVDQKAISPGQMKNYIIQYYLGLYKAVAKVETGDVSVNLLQDALTNEFTGKIDWIEPFVTKKPQTLMFKAQLKNCANSQSRWYFTVSPQPDDHSVWTALKALPTTPC